MGGFFEFSEKGLPINRGSYLFQVLIQEIKLFFFGGLAYNLSYRKLNEYF
jgi:hypothetical protein